MTVRKRRVRHTYPAPAHSLVALAFLRSSLLSLFADKPECHPDSDQKSEREPDKHRFPDFQRQRDGDGLGDGGRCCAQRVLFRLFAWCELAPALALLRTLQESQLRPGCCCGCRVLPGRRRLCHNV